MFKLLTNLTDRRSWIVVLCAVVFAGVAGYYGGPVASLMTDGDGDFRIITTAALLFCIAIGAFATSQIVIIKELGVGAALAVLIDATIVRALLVPSLMKLLGRRNWWSPRPLRWLHERIGLSENPQTGHAPVELGSPNRTMLGIQASGQPFDRETGNNYAKEER